MNAQTLALNEQRNASNIKNVVAFDEYNYQGQGNVGDTIKFVPGMTVVYYWKETGFSGGSDPGGVCSQAARRVGAGGDT